MGLAISRSIVTMHDGRIFVRSDPSGGTIFDVEFPIKSETAA